MALTETEKKLRDAATQMKLALKNTSDEEIVRSCVNSFISHARSVTFIMQKESAHNPKLRDWYVQEMDKLKDTPLLKFFNEMRVHTIHTGVVTPEMQTTRGYNVVRNGVPVPGDVKVQFYRFDGVEKYMPGDSGGVFRLCERYFLILRGLVALWVAKRRQLCL